MNTVLTVRIDENLNKEFNSIVDSLGLDAPTVVRMLIRQTVNQRSIPLSLSIDNIHGDSSADFLNEVHADWGEW
jgi:addiction module RelB/DinJ family antitoxin